MGLIDTVRNEGHTIGVEFGSKIVEVGGKRIKLQVHLSFLLFFICHISTMQFSLSLSLSRLISFSQRSGTPPVKSAFGIPSLLSNIFILHF